MDLEKLANTEIFNPDGKPARVGDVWKDQMAVVAFIRHFD